MLRISNISFPGLGIGEFSVDSVAFTLFGMDIAWYAILICTGMILCAAYVIVQAKKIGVTMDDVIDYALFTIPIGIVGARLYYVFSELDRYETIWEVFNIRQGGLAIYGGIIAGTLTVLVCSFVKKIDFFAFGDCVAPGVLLAQGIGRWGNFMNGEAFGYETDIFCRMGLQNQLTGGELIYVHPTFLYESLWNLLGVLLVYLFAKFIGKKYDGQLILLTFGWYGLGRMFIEGLRTDSLYIPGTDIRTSQALAAVVFVVFAILLVFFAIRRPKRPLYVKPAPEKKDDGKAGQSDFLVKIKTIFSKKAEADSSDSTDSAEKNNEEK